MCTYYTSRLSTCVCENGKFRLVDIVEQASNQPDWTTAIIPHLSNSPQTTEEPTKYDKSQLSH